MYNQPVYELDTHDLNFTLHKLQQTYMKLFLYNGFTFTVKFAQSRVDSVKVEVYLDIKTKTLMNDEWFWRLESTRKQ